MRYFFAAAIVMGAAASAEAAIIAPHRAFYDLHMVRSSEGAGLSGVSGRMAFEIQGSSCEGWTVSFRMVNIYRPSEGEVRQIDTQSTSYESGDGRELRYNQREFVNNQLENERRLKVSRLEQGGEGKGLIEYPQEQSFTITPDTMFPIQHQIRIMDSALKGENRDSSLIYDGSDGEKTYRAISFIGGKKEPGMNVADRANAKAAPLSELRSWPVTVSYYATGEQVEDVPSYQITFTLYENGVATGLLLDYGEFVLEGNLSELEMLKAEPCN